MFFELGQLLVMRGEERARSAFWVPMQMLNDGPRDGEAVVGRGPTTHLVEDDQ